ncbi:MAG: PcfB family protein [Oscillospiraceae bacterium]|nr:PcfB family protein [Oscillospiraceae bacterium]
MQEEINEKSINLGVRVGKVTADELRKALDKILADLAEKKAAPEKSPEQSKEPKTPKSPELKHGKQTLRQLHKHNDGLSTIELTDPNLRKLCREMKKNDIDFSVMKDGKGKYTLFFKGKNVDEITNAFKRYTGKMVDIAEKKSIKLDLKISKSLSQALNSGRNKVKNKSKGARDR